MRVDVDASRDGAPRADGDPSARAIEEDIWTDPCLLSDGDRFRQTVVDGCAGAEAKRLAPRSHRSKNAIGKAEGSGRTGPAEGPRQ